MTKSPANHGTVHHSRKCPNYSSIKVIWALLLVINWTRYLQWDDLATPVKNKRTSLWAKIVRFKKNGVPQTDSTNGKLRSQRSPLNKRTYVSVWGTKVSIGRIRCGIRLKEKSEDNIPFVGFESHTYPFMGDYFPFVVDYFQFVGNYFPFMEDYFPLKGNNYPLIGITFRGNFSLKPAISRRFLRPFLVAQRSKRPKIDFGRTLVKSTIWSHDGQKDRFEISGCGAPKRCKKSREETLRTTGVKFRSGSEVPGWHSATKM